MSSGTASVAVFVTVDQRYYRVAYERKKLALMFGAFMAMATVVLLLRRFEIAYCVRLWTKIAFAGGFAALRWRLGVLRPHGVWQAARSSHGRSSAKRCRIRQARGCFRLIGRAGVLSIQASANQRPSGWVEPRRCFNT